MENIGTPQPQTNKPEENIATNLALPSVTQQLQYPLDHVTQEILRDFINSSTRAFPIGSIFISVVSTDPATLLGYGTWSAFAVGKTLIGIDSGDADFDTVEETGGSKTHTLTTAEMPAHTHTNSKFQNLGGGANFGFAAGGYLETAATDSTGGGGSHNNLQPYIVTYMWKRDS